MASSVLLAVVTLALPWELYQRIPGVGGTLVKAAGALLVVCALVDAARHRFRPFPRTGLGPAVALFAAACVASTLWSLDRQASLSLLRVYTTYLLLFFAVVWTVRTTDDARRYLSLYVVSAGGVAILTLICYAGWIMPTWWHTAYWPQQPLIQEWRDGLPMRMVAASNDGNQGALFLLAAFALALFLWSPRGRRAVWWPGFPVVLGLFIAGIAVAMSRSSLVVCGLLLVAFAFNVARRGGKGWLVPAVLGIGALGVLAIHPDFASVLWERLQGGITRDDGSFRNRLVVYRTALELIPRYALTGSGLGASDLALARYSESVGRLGMTVHSMSLKFLLETGVFGLAAYLWLWWRAFRLVYRERANAPAFGAAVGSMLFACFVVLAIQPFQALSIFPVLVGLSLGPGGWERAGIAQKSPQDPRSQPLSTVVAFPAALLVGVFVAFNVVAYQKTFARVAGYGDALTDAIKAFDRTDSHRAEEGFQSAIKKAQPGTNEGTKRAGPGLTSLPFFSTAARVYDLPRVYGKIDLGIANPAPEAFAGWGLGRTLLAQGRVPEAQTCHKRAATADPRFTGALFDVAEAWWRRGHFDEALQLYERARSEEGENVFGLREAFMAKRLERIAGKPAPSQAEALERAGLLRRFGRWDEAVALYRSLAESGSPSPETLFNLGVDQELTGNRDAALRFYRKAVEQNPGYIDAQARLKALSDAALSPDP